MSSEPEMSDAQFTNLFSILIGGLIVLTIALVIVAMVIASDIRQSNINAQVRDSSMVERLEPAGQIAVGDTAQAAAASGAQEGEAASGESVYESSCAACHAAGVAGAPAMGDAQAWSDRIAKGIETMYTHAIEGFQGDAGMMPAKGGNTSLSDEAVKAAVDHMIQAVE